MNNDSELIKHIEQNYKDLSSLSRIKSPYFNIHYLFNTFKYKKVNYEIVEMFFYLYLRFRHNIFNSCHNLKYDKKIIDELNNSILKDLNNNSLNMSKNILNIIEKHNHIFNQYINEDKIRQSTQSVKKDSLLIRILNYLK